MLYIYYIYNSYIIKYMHIYHICVYMFFLGVYLRMLNIEMFPSTGISGSWGRHDQGAQSGIEQQTFILPEPGGQKARVKVPLGPRHL